MYSATRAYTEKLCEPLEIEDYIPQPSVDVSPPKWNIAHTTWFFEEMILKKFVPGYKVFDENFGFLFNSYYNSIGTRTVRDHRGDLSRPTVKHVFAYRKYVDEKISELLSKEVSEEIAGLIILGINHEQQHQELFLADLKYTLSVNPLFPVYDESFNEIECAESGASGFVEIEAGVYEIGHSGDGFYFDNERGRHNVYLHDFSMSRYLVTNAEFLIFIADGGYKDFRFWHSEGWDWVNQNRVDSPLYWQEKDGEWLNFTLGGLQKLHLDAPVSHLSFYEASAFAEYKGMRLPTELEWETASGGFDWGLRWEWTGSAYLPYPGFSKPAGAVGEYNGKFMINQMVLRGSSIATPPNHSRKTYRNFFHPHLRWQFTGLRLVR
ncbi:MAG: ergothioneine biosynthesis protein EgtB [Saprospiraceae bacterium]|nr:ergothioneine biosynthesis protein EgtB [Pyrinomonadaceae bacterium]